MGRRRNLEEDDLEDHAREVIEDIAIIAAEANNREEQESAQGRYATEADEATARSEYAAGTRKKLEYFGKIATETTKNGKEKKQKKGTNQKKPREIGLVSSEGQIQLMRNSRVGKLKS